MYKFSNIYLVVAFVFASIMGCVGQSKENRKIDSFDAIRVSEGIDAYIRQGNEETVRVEAEDIDIDKIATEVSGSTLKIYIDGNHRGSFKVKVYITFREVEELSVSSAGGIYGENKIKTNDLEISASSAGDIELDIEAESIELSASSSGDIVLSGSTNYLEASISSAGDLDAYDLDAKQVHVRVSSAGSARVTAIEKLDARASSGGDVRYRGNPKHSNTGSSSGGSIRKSN